eukprot:TRINITY_DN13816_c0_g1_i2.p1 TRINITY_DN13816_c0_g1~~TRINITY_DN13816_c0_g1_i2.p1  ORF type:complete len:1011 (-),score=157.19 TRINITY_DN13816_c0_g1_i2:84-3116(-)
MRIYQLVAMRHPTDEEIITFHDHLNINDFANFDEQKAGIEKGWQEQLLRSWEWDNLAYCKLLEHCSPEPGAMPMQLDCPIAIFHATEEPIFWRRVHDKREWMQFTSSGPFEIFDEPVNHDGMLKQIMAKLSSKDPEMVATWDRLVKPQPGLASAKSLGSCCPWQHVIRHDPACPSLIDEKEQKSDYRHIVSSAEVLACCFRAQGLQQGDRVMLVGEVSLSCLTTQLALVHCGAAAVLIGVGESSTYLAQVAESAGCSYAVILGGDLQVSDIPFELAELRQEAFDGRSEAAAFVERSAPATILFSSGSTGKPKGVVQSYGTLLALASDMSKSAVPTLWKGSIGWIANYALPHVLAGQHLLVVPRAVQLEPHSFQALRGRHNVQTLTMAPSELRAQLSTQDCLSDLQSITCIAEALPSAVALDFFRQYPHVKLLETYASSEVQGSNAFLSTEVSRDGSTGCFNVRPSQTVILVDLENPSRKIDMPGKSGELLLQPTASGYLDSAQTSQRFIPNSFGPGKLFRTGDICKWTVLGKQLQLCGRVDFQVKVSGKLVELEHVERAAESLPGIQQAAARTFVRSSGTMVVALFVAADKTNQLSTEADVKEQLKKVLPAHAVPATVGFLDAIPLLKNGKKDRKSLPEPEEDEEQVMVTDSIGMMQSMGARQAKEAMLRESLAGLVTLGVLCRHLADAYLKTFPAIWNIVTSLGMHIFFMVIAYMDGRSPASPSDFSLRCRVLLGTYLLMGIPQLLTVLYYGDEGLATFYGQLCHNREMLQRWSCLAVVLCMLVQRATAALGIPPWAASISFYVASTLAPYTLANGTYITWLQGHPMMVLFTDFSGYIWMMSMIMKLVGHYLAWFHLGRGMPSSFPQLVLGRRWQCGLLAGIAWIGLAQQTWIHDMSVALAVGTIRNPLLGLPEIGLEWLMLVMLLICLGPGNRFLSMLGENIVGNYLIHLSIPLNFKLLVGLVAPAGWIAQLLTIFAASVSYVLTIGYATQVFVVYIMRRLQGKSKSA